jgi:hypothetical protein
MTELRQLEQMLRTTPRNAPDRAAIMRRLAEGYAELAAWADRQTVEEELQEQRAKRREQVEKNSVTTDANQVDPAAKSTRPALRSTTIL